MCLNVLEAITDIIDLTQRTFLNFTQANLPALRTKIGQLNDTILADSVSPIDNKSFA